MVDVLDGTNPSTGKSYRQEILDDISRKSSIATAEDHASPAVIDSAGCVDHAPAAAAAVAATPAAADKEYVTPTPTAPFSSSPVKSLPPTTTTRTAPLAVPSGEDDDSADDSAAVLRLYREKREDLATFLKKEGNIFARGGRDTPVGAYVGLANQGATCYLNSLVQALFMLPSFRKRVFRFRHNPELHGDEAQCIPAQLQRLFARLRLSNRPYVSTKDLTRSFGWGSAEGFQQHDVQELLVTLMEALERSTPKGDFAKDLFQGSTSDYLKGEGFCRRKEPVAFNNLMVPIQGHETLESAIRAYFKPDVLDGANQYELEKGKKVNALKGAEVNMLPPVFVVNLGRFVFDYQTMRRVKINDACSFPEKMNMDSLLKGYIVASPSSSSSSSSQSIPAKENKENGIQSLTETNVDDGENSSRRGPKENASDAGGDGVPHLGTYELIATMVHSGTAQGGHYRAFIREQCGVKIKKSVGADSRQNDDDTDDTPSPRWYNFNDSFVSELTENEVVTMFGRDPTAEAAASDETDVTDVTDDSKFAEETAVATNDDSSVAPSKEEKKKERAAHVAKSSTTSYMLMYRRKQQTDTTKEGEDEEEDIALIPANLSKEIINDNFIVDEMSKAYVARTKIARLTVCLNSEHFGTVEIFKTATLEEATQEAARVLFSQAKQQEPALQEYRLRAHEPRSSRPGRTYGGREKETLIQLGLANGNQTLLLEMRQVGASDPPFEEYDPNDFYIQVDCWNPDIMDVVPLSGLPPIRVEGQKLATIRQLNNAVRNAVDGHNKKIVVAAGSSREQQQQVIGEYRLLYLDRKLGRAVNLSDSKDDDSKDDELRHKYQIYSGSSIVLERIGVDLDVAVEYETSQNVIMLRYNIPKAGVKGPRVRYDSELRCDKRDKLSDIKLLLQPTLGIEKIEHFRLKCNANAPVLKNMNETLGDNGFSQGSILHVEKGLQLTEDDVMIQFFKYEPYAENGKPFKALCRIPVNKNMTIADIKAKVAKSKKLNGCSPLHLRLHERKRTSGVHPLMRDDKTLRQSVKQLVDDTKLCVRLLEVPETVTTNDVVVVVKLWRPVGSNGGCRSSGGGSGGGNSGNSGNSGDAGVLDRGEDIVVRRHATAEELRAAVESVFRVTMGGVVEPLCVARGHLASANARDLKKKTMEMVSPSSGPSKSTLQWIALPSSNAKNGAINEEGDGGSSSAMADAGLLSSDVGGVPRPITLASDDVILNSPLGGLRDGTILFMHQGTELKEAVVQWTTPDAGDEGGVGGTGEAGGAVKRPLRRNPNWVGGGIVADGKKSIPRRGKEIGIKIRTQFDHVLPREGGEGNNSKKVATSVVAGGAMQAARLLQKGSTEEQ